MISIARDSRERSDEREAYFSVAKLWRDRKMRFFSENMACVRKILLLYEIMRLFLLLAPTVHSEKIIDLSNYRFRRKLWSNFSRDRDPLTEMNHFHNLDFTIVALFSFHMLYPTLKLCLIISDTSSYYFYFNDYIHNYFTKAYFIFQYYQK